MARPWGILGQRNAASFAITNLHFPPRFALKTPRQIRNVALGVPEAVSAVEMRRGLSFLGSYNLGVVLVPKRAL